MNALPLLNRLQTPAKRLWGALATHQNRGFFAAAQPVQLPSHADPRVHLPEGLDLRASGPGFDNCPARFSLSESGEAQVTVAGKTLSLGNLGGQTIEQGWMITGLRLRGAVRFAAQELVLLVPDREDLPYLLRALSPRREAPVQALSYRRALAA